MLNGKRVIAVVPARGGSKSVPGKNIRPLGGKPLLAWSIDVARQVSEIDRIIVSTDDDADCLSRPGPWRRSLRAPAASCHRRIPGDRRPQGSPSDASSGGETPEWVILLEPTCPLRTAEDVRDCLKLVAQGGYDSVATFKDAELNPHRAWRLVDGVPEVFIPGAIPWLPRQKLPKAYQLNGAVYVFRANLLAQEAKSLLVGKVGAVIDAARPIPRHR